MSLTRKLCQASSPDEWLDEPLSHPACCNSTQADEALKLGLVDAVVATDADVLPAARALVRKKASAIVVAEDTHRLVLTQWLEPKQPSARAAAHMRGFLSTFAACRLGARRFLFRLSCLHRRLSSPSHRLFRPLIPFRPPPCAPSLASCIPCPCLCPFSIFVQALDIADKKKKKVEALKKTDKVPGMLAANMIFTFARDEAGKLARFMQHPLLCIDCIEEGLVNGGVAGIRKEQEVFKKCVVSDASKGLVHMFFAQRNTANLKGITDKGLKPRKFTRVGVIGGGLMGSGIATALALSGISVVLKEVNQQFLDAGMSRINSNLQSNVKKGKLTKEAAAAILARVTPALEYSGFDSLDMVIEAVIEDLPLKQRIFADLERRARIQRDIKRAGERAAVLARAFVRHSSNCICGLSRDVECCGFWDAVHRSRLAPT